jgi:hypothetical protein
MSSPSSHEHALDAERRRRATLLPAGAACEACGESDPFLLDADLAMLLCADDAAIDQERDSVEGHHLAGRRWKIVLDLTPNWHRVVTALQRMERGVTHGKMAELLYGIAYLIIAIADYVDRLEKAKAKRHA